LSRLVNSTEHTLLLHVLSLVLLLVLLLVVVLLVVLVGSGPRSALIYREWESLVLLCSHCGLHELNARGESFGNIVDDLFFLVCIQIGRSSTSLLSPLFLHFFCTLRFGIRTPRSLPNLCLSFGLCVLRQITVEAARGMLVLLVLLVLLMDTLLFMLNALLFMLSVLCFMLAFGSPSLLSMWGRAWLCCPGHDNGRRLYRLSSAIDRISGGLLEQCRHLTLRRAASLLGVFTSLAAASVCSRTLFALGLLRPRSPSKLLRLTLNCSQYASLASRIIAGEMLVDHVV
jgi:hypothetical protein